LFIVLSGAVHVHKRKYQHDPVVIEDVEKVNNDLMETPRDRINDDDLVKRVSIPAIVPEDDIQRGPSDGQKSSFIKLVSQTNPGELNAGEGNMVVAIKSHYRYPAFGLVAGLRSREHQAMRDRTRRWEVRVRAPKEHKPKAEKKGRKAGSEKKSSSSGCCDVCYIDHFSLMQMFNSTWDEGPDQFLNFVK
jgi:hypothetical protein